MNNGYTGYFGLIDTPFSIAPNPHYLFMSDRHKEALAHLTYGLGEAGGFVLLTGEVGTGKTTVSKCLLEQLPSNTQAAFILNPTLSAKELLATICDELQISYDDTTATLKTYTDLILNCLLENHEQGKNTLLIIDEAQHLQAQVLEQLRLLTNLETHTKKLLQVILIGQPELQELLKRRDLRQLAQRITARYHLLPLNKTEVINYIQHRLAVAGCQKQLFSNSALSLIHKLSGGVPRLINLLCDRSLLGAYSTEKKQVSKSIVIQACNETLDTDKKVVAFGQQPWFKKSVYFAALVGLSVLGFGLASSQYEQIELAKQQHAKQIELQLEQAKKQDIERRLNHVSNTLVNNSRSLEQAFRSLYSHWQVNLFDQSKTPCQSANDFQLECYWYQGSVPKFLALGYPAVLRFEDNNRNHYFATYLGLNNDQVSLQFNNETIQVSSNWLANNWQGTAAILWRPPLGFIDKIGEDSQAELLTWLENMLSQAQQRPSRNINSFDALLLNQLQQFQQAQGISIKSYADIYTVMLLLNQIKPNKLASNNIVSLSKTQEFIGGSN